MSNGFLGYDRSVHVPAHEPERRKLSAAEVLRMVEVGILDEDEHVELVEGVLLVMSPQGPEHSTATLEVAEHLRRAYGATAHVRIQHPIATDPLGLPEPDVAVVRGRPRDFSHHHPTGADAILVVEVAATSQARDRQKARTYAAAGVPCLWLLDLDTRTLEVRGHPTGDRYRDVSTYGAHEEVALPEDAGAVRVADLLP